MPPGEATFAPTLLCLAVCAPGPFALHAFTDWFSRRSSMTRASRDLCRIGILKQGALGRLLVENLDLCVALALGIGSLAHVDLNVSEWRRRPPCSELVTEGGSPPPPLSAPRRMGTSSPRPRRRARQAGTRKCSAPLTMSRNCRSTARNRAHCVHVRGVYIAAGQCSARAAGLCMCAGVPSHTYPSHVSVSHGRSRAQPSSSRRCQHRHNHQVSSPRSPWLYVYE